MMITFHDLEHITVHGILIADIDLQVLYCCWLIMCDDHRPKRSGVTMFWSSLPNDPAVLLPLPAILTHVPIFVPILVALLHTFVASVSNDSNRWASASLCRSCISICSIQFRPRTRYCVRWSTGLKNDKKYVHGVMIKDFKIRTS